MIKTFEGFFDWLPSEAEPTKTKKRWWERWWNWLVNKKLLSKANNKIDDKDTAIADRITTILKDIKNQLYQNDETEVENTTKKIVDSNINGAAQLNVGAIKSGAEATRKVTESVIESEKTRRSKIDFLNRSIIEYQSVFREMKTVSNSDAYLILDDLYHIPKNFQVDVVDYFHRISREGCLWLKIGTVRHRSVWYSHGDPSKGLKLGDDADEINLDQTLEKYERSRSFLKKVLGNYAKESGIDTSESFILDSAIDRLVLASGGVARDFLTIMRKAIEAAREGLVSKKNRTPKVGVEDINRAAGEHDAEKREEFNNDAGGDQTHLNDVFAEIREFCLSRTNKNCFLIEKDLKNEKAELIMELVDLKLIHLVASRVTVSDRPGKIFVAYLLDVSQYAGTRAKRGLEEISFWERDNRPLRKVSLIFLDSSNTG